MRQGIRCYCGAQDHTLLFWAGGYHVVECSACKQVRVMTPSSLHRKQTYKKEDVSIYVEKEEMFRKIFCRIITFIKKYKSKGTLVDIGAGVGLLVDEANKAGFDAFGIEPSHAAVFAAKKFFHVSLLRDTFTSKKITKPIDIVVLNHVLEHLPDPKEIVSEITNVLKKDGLFVIGVPNFGSIMSIFKRNRWQSLSPEQHRWQFTPQSLDALVEKHGFKRLGFFMENHDRSIHPFWKQPIYWLLDTVALIINRGEAMLIIYRKV